MNDMQDRPEDDSTRPQPCEEPERDADVRGLGFCTDQALRWAAPQTRERHAWTPARPGPACGPGPLA